MAQQKYKLLTQPLTAEACDEDGYVKGVVAVDISDIVRNDLEEFLDLLSERLVGDLMLSDISYKVVGHRGDELHLEVSGVASEAVDQF